MPFHDIIGHRRVLSLLSRAIARETMPPALLMAGPEGIGKRRAAVAIAETLNCQQPRSSSELERDGCGECPSCRRIARGVHPDVIVIEPGETGSIKIEQVREVIDRAAYRPFEGRTRVVIIDEAETMAVPAQSALLKTLEEPPSASVFVLVSAMPDALLETIRSRCSRLRFGLLAPSEVADVLMRDHGQSEAEARAMAADADGSVGRALEAASTDLGDARLAAKRFLQDTARVTDPVRRVESAKMLTGTKGTPGGERDQLAVCLRALSSLLRDLGILATNADAHMLANADLASDLGRLTASWDSRRSMRAFMAVDRALAALERNVSPKVVADWLVLQF